MSWISESNRYKHLIGGMLLAIVLTALATIGCAIGMEFKDCHHDNGDIPFREWSWKCWDWLDFWATIIGGVIGQAIQILIIYLLILIF